MKMLHIDSITKSFDGRPILQDIYLGCKTGQIIGLLGRNGSGKSTLLQIIFGTISSDTQFIKCNDKVLRNLSDRRNKISYLPQNSFLPKNEKIKKLIPLFCNKENTDLLYSSSLIKPFLHEKPKNLSLGELRIIEALLIIHSDSDFILLDEPFHSLSPKISEELKKLIRLQTINKGIIISDHNYLDIFDISNDIYLLSNGYLKPIQDLKELQRYNYLPKSI
ncbi:ATP-binding cassette domain-containing protein [Chryseobacterium bernardetii]|uniref:ATP-binding cassette domain-containing protein n=1 Tax=Chryseobacterium bernardetii TaxID=1241978 RepID=UPI0030192AB2